MVSSTPLLASTQTLLLTGVFFCFFFSFIPGIFTLKSFLAGLPLDGAPCALTCPFLPSQLQAQAVGPERPKGAVGSPVFPEARAGPKGSWASAGLAMLPKQPA